MKQQILIVEDDMDLQEGLLFSFQSEGYEVQTASSIRECMEILPKYRIDAIILDCNLPDGDGFTLCTRIKKSFPTPILMLTARDSELDEVKALALGMDDFMSKPFSLAVLKARVKKLLSTHQNNDLLVSNGISINKNDCKVYKQDKELSLSKIEYQILLYFLEHRNQVLSKEQILSHIWDCHGNYVTDNTVAVNIKRLRGKIEDRPDKPARIKTIHGMGYIWKESE